MNSKQNNNFKVSGVVHKYNKLDGQQITLFGYDEKNKYLIKKIDNFIDWFCFPVKEIRSLNKFSKDLTIDTSRIYTSLYGEELYKIYYVNNAIRKKVESEFSRYVYMSDISPALKYIIENNLHWSNFRHVFYLDIEVEVDKKDIEGSRPERADQKITSICIYSNFLNKYLFFSWHESFAENLKIEKREDENNIFYFCRNEREVLLTFCEHISKLNPDVITGWWSGGFDIPYIARRLERLKMGINLLSPVGKAKVYKNTAGYWKIYIDGIDHIDLMDAVSKHGNIKLTDYKLNTAAIEILDEKISKYEYATWEDWKTNYSGFIKYAIRDVELLYKIDSKLKLIDFYTKLQSMVNLLSLEHVFYVTSIIENYLVTKYWNKIMFQNKHNSVKQPYLGAYVQFPKKPGLHKNVAVLDFASLYPCVMMAYNISPETFIVSENQAKKNNLDLDKDIVDKLKEENSWVVDTGKEEELFGKRYIFAGHNFKTGIFAESLKDLYSERLRLKSEMKKYKYKSEKYQIAYNNQISIKNILNSMYGAMGSNYFRLYQPECADAITYFARKSILYAREYFEKLGYIVNYIDTDSIFLLLQDKDPEEVKKELPKFIISLKENVVKKYCTNIDDSFYMFDLEFEKLLTHVYFSNTKKRYYGIQDTGEKYIRGLNIIRKDTPLFLKKELDVLSEKVVRGELTLNYLNNLKNKVESADYIDVGIIKSYTKKLRSYVKTMPQHVKAANFANKVFNTSITYIDNPYMFYITAKEYPENTEICLLPENFNILKSNDVFEIDYNTFFDKQVITPLEEFKYIDEIKDLVFEYKSQNKEFYASYFKRINKIKEKLSIGKELGKGEMIIYEENKKNILLYNE